MTSTTPDFEAIKKTQRAGWQTGDYPRVGNTLQIIAELLVEAADVRAGQKVLDVACGQGNVALAAALRFAEATGVDYAVNLLERGRARAAAERLRVTVPGGTIGHASWTPTGMIGNLFKTVSGWNKPPAGLVPPTLWG